MTLIWVLIVFLGNEKMDPVFVNSIENCLELQKRVLGQNFNQVIASGTSVRAYCIPQRTDKIED